MINLQLSPKEKLEFHLLANNLLRCAFFVFIFFIGVSMLVTASVFALRGHPLQVMAVPRLFPYLLVSNILDLQKFITPLLGVTDMIFQFMFIIGALMLICASVFPLVGLPIQVAAIAIMFEYLRMLKLIKIIPVKANFFTPLFGVTGSSRSATLISRICRGKCGTITFLVSSTIIHALIYLVTSQAKNPCIDMGVCGIFTAAIAYVKLVADPYDSSRIACWFISTSVVATARALFPGGDIGLWYALLAAYPLLPALLALCIPVDSIKRISEHYIIWSSQIIKERELKNKNLNLGMQN